MTNREKMEHHIYQAERWQAQVNVLEKQAMELAEKKVQKTEYRGQVPELVAAKILETNFWYRKSTRNRDAHQEQARMYGLAAIVDAIAFPTVERRETGDGRVHMGEAQVPDTQDSEEDEGVGGSFQSSSQAVGTDPGNQPSSDNRADHGD